jgi:acetyl esterase
MADELEQHPSYSIFREGFFLSARAMDFFGGHYRGDANDRRTYASHLISAGTDVIYLEMRGSIHGWVNMRKALPSTAGDLADILAAMKLMLARHG